MGRRRLSILYRFILLFFLLLLVAIVSIGLIGHYVLGIDVPPVIIGRLTLGEWQGRVEASYVRSLHRLHTEALPLLTRTFPPTPEELQDVLGRLPEFCQLGWTSVQRDVQAVGDDEPAGEAVRLDGGRAKVRARFAVRSLATSLFQGLTEGDVDVGLYDPNGRRLFPPGETLPASIDPQRLAVRDMVEESHGLLASYLWSALPLPEAGLYVVFRRNVYQAPRASRALLFSVPMIALFLLLGATAAANYVIRPLRHVERGARHVADGHLHERIPVLYRDEVGDLADTLNHMAEMVEQREQELREKNVELERASELKTRFLANVSHELRTPLTSIIGYCEMLRDGLEGPLHARQADILDTVRRNASALLALINDLLDLTKIEANRLELALGEVFVGECLESAYEMVKPQVAAKGLDFVVELPETPLLVRGDFDRLRQVFVNLFSNAVKFTPAGSVGVTARQGEASIDVDVWDTGIGVAPEASQRVFEEFRQADERTHRQYGGTGLGLAICRKIVELHGGQITLAARAGGGSVFTVSLPRAGSDAPGPTFGKETEQGAIRDNTGR